MVTGHSKGCCHGGGRLPGHNTQDLDVDKFWIVLQSVNWLATRVGGAVSVA